MNTNPAARSVGPLVSVIIPAYGHAGLILETLGSVFAQTFTDCEIIVVNDGSPDDTAARLRPLAEAGRIRYFEQPNGGQASARNRGLAEARGEFIAFLDDDDLWPPDKLAWQAEWLQSHPDYGVIGGSCEIVDAAGRSQGMDPTTPFGPVTLETLAHGNAFCSPGQTLIRAAILRQTGGFNPRYWGCDDYDLFLRLSHLTRLEALPRPALRYRVHGSNASRNTDRMYDHILALVEDHIRQAPAASRRRLRADFHAFLYQYAGFKIVRSWAGRFRENGAWAGVAHTGPTLRRLLGFARRPVMLRLFAADLWSLLGRTCARRWVRP